MAIVISKPIEYGNGSIISANLSYDATQFITGSPAAQFTVNTSGTTIADTYATFFLETNQITWGAGKVGSCIICNGSTSFLSGGYVLGGLIAPTRPEKTITAWINYAGSGLGISGGQTCIIGGRYNDNFVLIVNTNKTILYQEDDSFTTTTQSIVGSGWEHIALTSKLNSGSPWYHIFNIFLNGNSLKTGSFLHTTGNPSSQGQFYIGYEGRNLLSFNGKIDDVRIYNRVLSSNEIQAIYNNGSGTENLNPTCYSGIIPYVTNNGNDWNIVSPGSNYTFSTTGNDLRWKIETGSNVSGAITNLQIVYNSERRYV